MQKTSFLTALAAAALAIGGVGLGAVAAQAATIPPGGEAGNATTQSVVKKVQVLTSAGTPAQSSESLLDEPTAYPGEILRYTVTYSLAGSVNVASLELFDRNQVVIGGYGSYVGKPTITAVAHSDSVIDDDPTGMSVAVKGEGTSSVLSVDIAPNQTSGGYLGIADGVYTITYDVQLNTTIPTGDSLMVPSATSGLTAAVANPAQEVGGVADVANAIDVVAVDNTSASDPISTKDLGNGYPSGVGSSTTKALVNLLPTPVASYSVITTADQAVTAGETVKFTTTVANTGNVPLDYAGNPDLGIDPAASPTVTISLPADGATYNKDAVISNPTAEASAAVDNGSVDNGASLSIGDLGYGQSASVTWSGTILSTATDSLQTTTTPVVGADESTTATHAQNPSLNPGDTGDADADSITNDEATVTIGSLTPTGAILLTMQNNAGLFTGLGLGLVALAAIGFVVVRRRGARQAG